MTDTIFFRVAGAVAIGSPAVLLALLGLPALLDRRLSERAIARATAGCVICGLVACILVLVGMLATGDRSVILDLGDPLNLPEEHFHFHVQFLFDRLSVPFVILTFVLVGATGKLLMLHAGSRGAGSVPTTGVRVPSRASL